MPRDPILRCLVATLAGAALVGAYACGGCAAPAAVCPPTIVAPLVATPDRCVVVELALDAGVLRTACLTATQLQKAMPP